ncbi:MAG: hypothetical protein ACI37T_00510 [Candidatus Gastranaerophilaceae bacterium]
MTKEYIINNPIDIFLIAHREALKNAMANAFEELGKGNIAGYEEQEKQRIYHTGAITALEDIKNLMNKR